MYFSPFGPNNDGNLKMLSSQIILQRDMYPWSTKPVLSRWGIFVSNRPQYIAWVKIINFSFMPKIFSILSKDHVA